MRFTDSAINGLMAQATGSTPPSPPLECIMDSIISILNSSVLLLASATALIHTPNDTTLSLTTDMLEEMIDVCLEDSDFSDDFLTPPKRKRRHDRSLENSSGKKQMVKYNRARAKQAVLDDYLGPIPIFKDRQFERVFRITKSKL